MPKDGTATRQRILDAAERLAIDNGFAATSIDQVIAASGTSKGAFFHHFDSKLALAIALVERYAAGDIDQLNAALAAVRAASDDPAEQVIAFIQYFEDGADELMAGQSSCLYISVLTERQLVRAGTRELIVRAVLAYRTELSRLLQAALRAQAGEPGQPGQPSVGAPVDAEAVAEEDDSLAAAADALADHVFVTFEGAFILARSTGYPGHMRAQLSVLRQLLQSLLAPASDPAGPPGPGEATRPGSPEAGLLEAAGQPASVVA